VYLPLERLIQSCLEARNTSRKVDSFEIGVFTGEYITELKKRFMVSPMKPVNRALKSEVLYTVTKLESEIRTVVTQVNINI
jgi:hypothetical protein